MPRRNYNPRRRRRRVLIQHVNAAALIADLRRLQAQQTEDRRGRPPMNTTDWDALKARVAAARAELDQAKPDQEPEPETYPEIVDRFEGRESSEIADRMFRH